MAELLVINGVCAGTVFFLPDVPTVLGRSPEAHLQIADPWISSMHAMFERRGEDVWLIDLESRNGTFADEVRVHEQKLPPTALLRFGKTEVRFERRGEQDHAARLLGEGGTVVRYLDDLEAELDPARAGAARRDTIRAEPGPPVLARRQLAVLEEISRALVDADGLDPSLSRILFAVARALRAERSSLLLGDDRGEMVPRAVEPPGSPPALSSTVVAAAAQSRAGILTLDAQTDARFSASQSIIAQGIRSAMAVPIWASHRVLGMLLFDRGATDPFTPEDLELAALVGHQAALAIERARFLERVRADDDRRRALAGHLPDELARAVAAHDGADRDPLELAIRDVAIVRASVAGTTALPAADAADALARALEAAADAALGEGAAVSAAGAGILAVFGVPERLADGPARAVRAARAMRDRVRALGRGLDLRAAVDAGSALCGNVAGPRGFALAAAGDAADRAERLLALAAPGEVLAGEGVREAGIRLEPAGERGLGGGAVFRAG